MARPTVGGECGHALLTSLMMTAALMPIGAFALMQARTDLLINHHVRAGLEASSAAESGLEHALADLRRDASFDRLRVGADGTEGTADDRMFAFVAAPTLMLDAPLRYEIEVRPRSDELIDIVAHGFGAGLANRTVAATVQRGGALLQGAICAAASPLDVLLSGSFAVSGHDQAGHTPPLPALALSHDEAVSAVHGTLPDTLAAQLAGDGGPPSITTKNCPPVDALAAGFAAESSAQTVGTEVSGSLGTGVFLSSGSVQVSSADGSGVLVVNGDLRVDGSLTFSGLLLVLGDMVFESASTVRIAGGIVQGSTGRRLHLFGSGQVLYDSLIIDDLDRRFPERLPRRAIVLGRRDF